GPLLFWFRDRPAKERVAIALFGSTSLPLLIALTEIGVQTGHMTDTAQASVIGAGVVSVLLFPIVGTLLSPRAPAGAEPIYASESAEGMLDAERELRAAAEETDDTSSR